MELPRAIAARLVPLDETAGVEGAAAESITMEAAVTDADRINMPMQTQRGKQWCWAAVAVSFQDFLHTNTLQQCSVAKIELNHNDHDCCAVDPPLPQCDQEAPLEDGFNIVGVNASVQTSALIFPEVRAQVTARRPVACFIEFPPPMLSHFVQIDGYIDGSPRQYIVNDPQRGEVTLSVDDLLANYDNRHGRWRRSFVLT